MKGKILKIIKRIFFLPSAATLFIAIPSSDKAAAFDTSYREIDPRK